MDALSPKAGLAVNDDGIAFWPLGGDGPPALLLHGFASDHLVWLANQQAITSVATAAALDLPGHGESSMEVGEGTVGALAERVAALIDRRNLGRIHLIGHSLGGGVALALAEARPDLVASLCLIASAGLGGDIDRQFLSDFPRLEKPEAAIVLLQRLVVRPRLINQHLVARVLAQLARPGAREALARIAEGIDRSRETLARAVAAIVRRDLPRLVVWGEQDAISPPAKHRLDAFGGEILLIEEAGHLPHVEAARLVNERISDFLRRQTS